MALKQSTGLRNFLLGGGSLRKAFEDAVLQIYSGTAPTSADDAATGMLLCTVSKGSGAVAAGDRSTPKRYKVVIGSHGLGETFKFNVSVDGVGPTLYTFTNTPDAGDADAVAKKIAQILNDVPQLVAIAEGANGALYVASDIAGLDFTLADAGGGSGTITSITQIEAAVRANTIQFAAPSSGSLAKNSDVWSGIAAADGTANYFRLVHTDDNGQASQSQIRLQGNISTSGAELDISNINIVRNATQTVDEFTLTDPAS